MPRVLVLHGLGGSGPDHWQTWLAGRLGHEAAYPDLPDPDLPQLGDWLTALDACFERLSGPDRVVVCHSLACILWLHHAARRGPARADRVLLVAPPGPVLDAVPELRPFFPIPDGIDLAAAATGETRLVYGTEDPYCPTGADREYASLALPTLVLEHGGHLNTDAGFGPWPAVEDWVRYGTKNGALT